MSFRDPCEPNRCKRTGSLALLVGAFAALCAVAATTPARAADIPAYGGAWPVVHHDNRNSDCAPVAIADSYSRAFVNNFPQVDYTRPVIGPNGNAHFTYSPDAPQAPSFGAFDGQTGDTLFTVSSPIVDAGVITGNALTAADGSIYVSDDTAITKLTSAGAKVWSVPIHGAISQSLQFIQSGHLLGFTWNGWAYVIAQSDGHIVLEQNMTPSRTYAATRPSGCLLSGSSIECAYSRAPAVSPTDSKVYQTYTPSDPTKPGAVHAYRLMPGTLTTLWSQASLEGGAASNVVVSADYQRVYVADKGNDLVAMNAVNGNVYWRLDLGFAATSLTVSEDGYVMPGGDPEDPNYGIVLVHDDGAAGSIVYENGDYAPVSSPAGGLDDRFAVVATNLSTDATELLVLDPTGVLSASPWGDSFPPTAFGGLSLSADGWLYLTGLDGESGLFAFRPYIEHQDVETGMFSNSTQMISLRYMRHLWTASDGTLVTVVQQGGFGGHGLTLYKSVDGGLTWTFGLDLMSDVVISDGILLADDSLLLVASALGDNALTDVTFIRLDYDAPAHDWSIDPLTPRPVFTSTPTSQGSRATIAVDSNGVLWSAFRQEHGGKVRSKLYYSTNGGRKWKNSGNTFGSANNYSDKGAKVLAAGGRIVVVHHDLRGPSATMKRFKAWAYRDDSAPLDTVMPSADIARMVATGEDPFGSHWSVAADSAGDLHMSYEDGTARYLTYDGALDAWSAPRQLATGDIVYNSLSVSETDDVYVFAKFDTADKIYVTRYLQSTGTWGRWVSVSRQPYSGFLRMASPEHFEGPLPMLFQVEDAPSRLLFNNIAVEYLNTTQ